MGRGLGFFLALGLLGAIGGLAVAEAGLAWPAVLLGLLGVAGFGELVSHGLEGVAAALGLGRRSSLVVVNSLAVAPELVLAYSVGRRGVEAGETGLVEASLISLLVGASASVLVLSLLALYSRGVETGEMARLEAPLLRATVASLLLVSGYAVVEKAYLGVEPQVPPEAGLGLLGFMAVYLVYAARREAPPAGGGARAAALLALGLLGLTGAAEAMSRAVEALVAGLSPGRAGLLLGLAGVAPEAVLNLSAAGRRPGEAVAGLTAAAAATVLLAYGALEVLLPLPLDRYVVYSMTVLAAALWLLAAGMETRGRLEPVEAVFTAMLSATGLALLARV